MSRVVDVSSQNGENPQSSRRAQLLDRDVLGRLEHPVPDLLRRLDARVDRGDDADEDPLVRLHVVADDLQDADAVLLARQGDVEVPDLQLEQAGQQLGVIDVPAVGRVAVAAGAGVHADALAVLGGEPRQGQVVQVDEAVQQVAGRVDLDRQPPLGEVDLHLVRALPQAVADLGLVLAQQVVDELLAGVAGDLVGRVHEAQGRGRDDRLLHRPVGVLQGHVQVAVRVPLVAERPGRQPRHPADVAGRERDLEAVRGRVRQPVDAVGPEVVVLPLLAVGDDRRAGGLEPLDGVPDRLLVERVQRRVRAVRRRDRLDQPQGPRDTADRLGWDFHCLAPYLGRVGRTILFDAPHQPAAPLPPWHEAASIGARRNGLSDDFRKEPGHRLTLRCRFSTHPENVDNIRLFLIRAA